MIKKVSDFLFSRESLYVFVLFLLFAALRTQVGNLMYYLFDQLFLDGIISKIYTYNYRGNLLGCEQVLKWRESSKNLSWFQHYGSYYIQYLPSLIAIILLLRRRVRSHFVFWLLVVVSCFSILTSIIDIQYLLAGRIKTNTIGYIILYAENGFFIGIGLYILLKLMNRRQRLKVYLIALPAFLIGSYLWYRLIGPSILPIMI